MDADSGPLRNWTISATQLVEKIKRESSQGNEPSASGLVLEIHFDRLFTE
jgi:hypothetical protein